MDLTHDPIVIVHLRGTATDEQYRAYLANLEERLLSPKRYGQVLDFTHVDKMPPSQRKQQAAWIKRHFDRIENDSFGTALVLPRARDRFVLSSLMLLTKMPQHQWVVDTVEKGLQRVRASMKEIQERGQS